MLNIIKKSITVLIVVSFPLAVAIFFPNSKFFLFATFLFFLLAVLFSLELSFFLLGDYKIKQLVHNNSKKSKKLNIWIEHPNKTLLTIMLLKTLIVVLLIYMFVSFFGLVNIILVMFFFVFFFLLIELIPTTIAIYISDKVLLYGSFILYPFFYLLKPLTLLLNFLLNSVLTMLGRESKNKEKITEADLALFIEEKGAIEDVKKKMVSNIFEISDIQAKEVMVSRTNMLAVPVDISRESFLALLREHEYSRIPVYENTLDNIQGIIYAKDLLSLAPDWQMSDLIGSMHKAIFVPETKKIYNLMREFQKQRQQMAIVVDEYGGVAGIITMEDILEEIVGEIWDEHDDETDEAEVKEIGLNHYRINALMNMDDFCDYFKIERTENMSEYDTVGGLIYDIANAIPSVGDEFDWNDYKIIVTSMDSNRLECIDFIKKEN